MGNRIGTKKRPPTNTPIAHRNPRRKLELASIYTQIDRIAAIIK